MNIKISAIAVATALSLLLAGCNDDSSPDDAVAQPGTSNGSFGPIVQNGIVVDNGFVEDKSATPVVPKDLEYGKGFVANNDITAFSDFSRFEFSQVRVSKGRDALLLNNGTFSSAYSGFGVKVNDPFVAMEQGGEYSRIESQSEGFIKQMKAGIQAQYVGAKINTLAFERTRNTRSAVLKVSLEVDIDDRAVTSSNLLRLNIMANTLNSGYQPYFYPITDYASDGDMKVDLVFWQDDENVYTWVSTYPKLYSDDTNSKYGEFIAGNALASTNSVLKR